MHERPDSGFTFVEIIVVVAILSFLLVIITGILSSVINLKLDTEATSAIQQDSKYILSKLNYDAVQAQSVTTPTLPGDEGSTLQFVIDSLNYTYTLNSGNLQLTTPSGTYNMNSYNSVVTQFHVKRYGNTGGKPTFKITLELTSRTQRTQGAEVTTLNTTIGLR